MSVQRQNCRALAGSELACRSRSLIWKWNYRSHGARGCATKKEQTIERTYRRSSYHEFVEGLLGGFLLLLYNRELARLCNMHWSDTFAVTHVIIQVLQGFKPGYRLGLLSPQFDSTRHERWSLNFALVKFRPSSFLIYSRWESYWAFAINQEVAPQLQLFLAALLQKSVSSSGVSRPHLHNVWCWLLRDGRALAGCQRQPHTVYGDWAWNGPALLQALIIWRLSVRLQALCQVLQLLSKSLPSNIRCPFEATLLELTVASSWSVAFS